MRELLGGCGGEVGFRAQTTNGGGNNILSLFLSSFLLFVLFLGFSLLPSPTLTASYRLQKP